MTTAIAENVPEGRDAQVLGIRIDDYIYVDLMLATPIGDVPFEVAVLPTVSDGALTTQVVSLTANGFELPVSLVEGLSVSPGSGLVDSRCLTLRDARVEGDTVVLSADAATGCE